MMAAAAIGGLLTALAVIPSADALPLAKSQQASPQGVVTQVARGGPGGRGPGGGFSGRTGGFSRGMRGPGPGSFSRGPRGPSALYRGPRGGGQNHHHHHHPRFRGFYYAVPFVGYGAYYYGGGYGDDCRWLRRRALATGSAYWWDRYYACIED
jgi:hypothetical protein